MELAYFVHNLDPVILRIGPVALHWYGLAYVTAFVVGFFLYRWLCIRGYCEMPTQDVADFITNGAIFGVLLGGRLGWVLFYNLPESLRDPLSIFKVWEGGMSSHGGMLGLIFYTLWYARQRNLSWLGIGDNLCVVAPIGLCFGRIANFINGELPGKPTHVPWAVIFPPDPQPRHPSQLYEAALEGVLLFALLWTVRLELRVPRGVITGTFFVGYAVLRYIGEIFREPDPAWAVGRMSAGQFLSIFLIFIGVGFAIYGMKKQKYERMPPSQT